MYHDFASVLNIDTLLSRLAIELASVQVVPCSLVIVKVIVNVQVVDAGGAFAFAADATTEWDRGGSVVALDKEVCLVGSQCASAANLDELLAVAYVEVAGSHQFFREYARTFGALELLGNRYGQVRLVAWDEQDGLLLAGSVLQQERCVRLHGVEVVAEHGLSVLYSSDGAEFDVVLVSLFQSHCLVLVVGDVFAGRDDYLVALVELEDVGGCRGSVVGSS